ncbi:hypothetical protein [Helicobacter mehlei]|uniref:Uncharacterized protein n=1 Tax=Helicobacter mehlei TaxID=2316080 RepID=A0A553UZV2_9HELI|nr:hypothetical protein [Helicobacter mehlei]TSA85739.1 hypothetical protein FNE76_03035 [Helicobacter mehlei]
MKSLTILFSLVFVGVLHAQSGYCSSDCMGTPDERLAPMEFHFSLVHSVEHYLKHPKSRKRMLQRCHEAFTSTNKINYISDSFKQDCDNANQAQEMAHSKAQG